VYLKQDRPGDARICLDKAARLEKSPRETEEYLETLRQWKAKTNERAGGRPSRLDRRYLSALSPGRSQNARRCESPFRV
jgi:hypothetical protein